jgi:hypothetical protein
VRLPKWLSFQAEMTCTRAGVSDWLFASVSRSTKSNSGLNLEVPNQLKTGRKIQKIFIPRYVSKKPFTAFEYLLKALLSLSLA